MREYIRGRYRSFGYAINGFIRTLALEPNFRIHLFAAVTVIVGGFFLDISSLEWLAISLSIGSVLAAEGFNTAIELICDHVTPDEHEHIKVIKDVAAASVFITAAAALAVGSIIFLPKLL